MTRPRPVDRFQFRIYFLERLWPSYDVINRERRYTLFAPVYTIILKSVLLPAAQPWQMAQTMSQHVSRLWCVLGINEVSDQLDTEHRIHAASSGWKCSQTLAVRSNLAFSMTSSPSSSRSSLTYRIFDNLLRGPVLVELLFGLQELLAIVSNNLTGCIWSQFDLSVHRPRLLWRR